MESEERICKNEYGHNNVKMFKVYSCHSCCKNRLQY